jgi:hypothetical protein
MKYTRNLFSMFSQRGLNSSGELLTRRGSMKAKLSDSRSASVDVGPDIMRFRREEEFETEVKRAMWTVFRE